MHASGGHIMRIELHSKVFHGQRSSIFARGRRAFEHVTGPEAHLSHQSRVSLRDVAPLTLQCDIACDIALQTATCPPFLVREWPV